MRAQVEFDRASNHFRILSRGNLNQEESMPALVQKARQAMLQSGLSSCVLDSEIITISRKYGKILPFSSLMRRRGVNRAKSLDDQAYEELQVFDVLQLNGASLTSEPLRARKRKIPELGQVFKTIQYREMLSNYQDQLKQFYQESSLLNFEGIMLKRAESKYSAGERSNWAKIKANIFQASGPCFQSVDLVAIGGYYGNGKYEGLLSSFLMACPKDNKLIPICKVGSGFTYDECKSLTAQALKNEGAVPSLEVKYGKVKPPDVILQPFQVFEIAYQQPTLSLTYRLGCKENEAKKGFSLRFPSFKGRRVDKTVDDATSGDQLSERFEQFFKKRGESTQADEEPPAGKKKVK